ncbi:MAG: acyl transferase [Chitinophagaceae bacterium]|nr:acyl transferase [Chitinophagaceae bacterium]
MNCELEDKIFSVDEHDFGALALEIFHFQSRHNDIYRQFIGELNIDPSKVADIAQIPFLPVGFFKRHDVKTGAFEPEVIFESSGTTHSGNSRHAVKRMSLYRNSFLKAFQQFYGSPEDWHIIGLLPSYLERQHSSLVAMVDELIVQSKKNDSGFYLYETDKLIGMLRKNEQAGQKTLLIGVTFALLDLAEQYQDELRHTVVMETGGMKGRRKELTREETHTLLKKAWGLPAIHSEYGMTELLSQAYSHGDGLFRCPPWMKIVLREEDDPLSVKTTAGTKPFLNGIINVIDLANIYSVSFIAVDDIGRLYPDGSFAVTGRMDGSDVRGCNLMYGI